MRTEIKELKRIARGNLRGHYSPLIRVLLFSSLVVSLIEMPFSMMTNEIAYSPQNIIYEIASLLITIASVVLTVGQYRLHLILARTGEIHLSEFFEPLKKHSNRLILTEALLFGIEFIGLLPLIGAVHIFTHREDVTLYLIATALMIIGVIISMWFTLTFGLVYFALIDNEELSLLSAVKYIMGFMKSHKKRYLYLTLSFTGMLLLCILSLGIGVLWVEPYIMQTTTLFYLDIKGELSEVLENRKKNGPTPEPVAFNQYV